MANAASAFYAADGCNFTTQSIFGLCRMVARRAGLVGHTDAGCLHTGSCMDDKAERLDKASIRHNHFPLDVKQHAYYCLIFFDSKMFVAFGSREV